MAQVSSSRMGAGRGRSAHPPRVWAARLSGVRGCGAGEAVFLPFFSPSSGAGGGGGGGAASHFEHIPGAAGEFGGHACSQTKLGPEVLQRLCEAGWCHDCLLVGVLGLRRNF